VFRDLRLGFWRQRLQHFVPPPLSSYFDAEMEMKPSSKRLLDIIFSVIVIGIEFHREKERERAFESL
jgi:hypothetical protein